MNERVDFDAVRRDQLAVGSRMAREDGSEAIVVHPTPRRDFAQAGPIRSPYKKAPAKPVGHEAFLKQLEGKRIELEKIASGEVVTGKVKCSDRYTVTLKVEVEDGIFHDRVIFKHDISEFRSIDPKPALEEGAPQ